MTVLVGSRHAAERVWLTGASGFVGRAVLARLIESGRSVVCLVRDPGRLAIPPGGGGRVTAVAGDLADGEALRRCAAQADAAVHLVGIIAQRRGQTYQRVHVDGTRAVVEALAGAGVRRYVHMSAMGARADAPAAYHRSKAAAERIVRDSGLDWTIVRPSVIHGPDGEFMRMLARFARGFGPMPMLGPGRSRLAPIWAGDVAAAFVAALGRDATVGQTYELAGPRAVTWNEMFEVVARALRGRPRRIAHLPTPLAKALGRLFDAIGHGPFTRDQAIMAQEDQAPDPGPAARALGLELADFETKLNEYKGQLK